MQDGRYLATFEVVNRPSQSQNTAPVYFKTSPDGLNWSPVASIGTKVALKDGRGIGSTPFVKWVPTGGPKGMVIIASKWSLDAAGNIDGGQNFYVNYNLGDGPWERLPFAVTYDASDTQGGSFTGFAQGFDTSVDGRALYQATNVENPVTTYNDVRVGSIPLEAQQYEAERAIRQDAALVNDTDACNGAKVGNINNAGSSVTFTVKVPAAGTYTLNMRYTNGTGANSSHSVKVNGGTSTTLNYPATVDWGRYGWAQMTTTLAAGTNNVSFTKGSSYAELDALHVYSPSAALDPQFRVTNRNSGKSLEIVGASTTDGAGAGQWETQATPPRSGTSGKPAEESSSPTPTAANSSKSAPQQPETESKRPNGVSHRASHTSMVTDGQRRLVEARQREQRQTARNSWYFYDRWRGRPAIYRQRVHMPGMETHPRRHTVTLESALHSK